MGAAAAGKPAHGVGVEFRGHDAHDQRELVFGERPVLDLGPGLAESFFGDGQKARPVAAPLEFEFEIGDQRVGAAITETRLQLAERGGVDVLVAAGDTADVEDHGDGVDFRAQCVPGGAQVVPAIRGVAAEPCLGE